jgi:SAM-dependent methyltransferase
MVDWEREWHAGIVPRRPGAPKDWDERAPSFARHETGYAEEILRLTGPEPSWTVLDVGCGPGTLAIPFAKRARAVTALDFSPAMLDMLRAQSAEERLDNVRAVLGSWQDDWDELGIGVHDLVIASRSLVVDDLRAALHKLDARAARMVCLSTAVGDGPHDRRIFEAVGRPFQARPDYLTVYGLLHQMGIYADLSLIARQDWKVYESHDAAAEALAWMLRGATPEELERLRAYLARELVRCGSGWRLPAPRTVRWAVIQWVKDASASDRWLGLHGPRPERSGGR